MTIFVGLIIAPFVLFVLDFMVNLKRNSYKINEEMNQEEINMEVGYEANIAK